jgi:hypothetical protein
MMIISVLQRSRFAWLNLLFAGYLLFLQPAVLERLSASTQSERPDWLMAGVLLGLQVVEIVGLLLKRRLSAYYAQRYPNPGDKGGWRDNFNVVLYVFTPVFHIGFSAFLTIVAFGLLGIGLNDKTAMSLQYLQVLLFFVVLTKEAFFSVLLLSIGSAPVPPDKSSQPQWITRLNRWLSPPATTQLSLKDAIMDILGDLLLLVFSTLSYTASWDFVIASSPLQNPGSVLPSEYLGLSILFFMVYFTTRAIYLMQEISIRQSQAARIFSWTSFVAVWLTALWSIPKQ